MRKTPEPLTGESTKAFRMASNDLFPAPNQLEEPKIEYVYRTEEIKEIVLEGEEAEELDQIDECPLESRFISVTPKDVLILRQFINRDGSLKVTINYGFFLSRKIKVLRRKNTRAYLIVNTWSFLKAERGRNL